MSMITEHVRLRADSSRGVDVDTAWAGVRYLLSTVDAPVDVVSGGRP